MSLSIHDDYKIGRTIGQGHFAQVKLAVHRKSGQQVAVKCFTITSEKENDKMKARREIRIMSHVDHPNCVQLLGAYASSKRIYLVMELLTGGELFERIIAKEQYSETEAVSCFTQIMSAIEYLHFKGVCHRDVKPENILYATPAEDSPIKLVDFGLGSLLDMKKCVMRTVVGTPAYAAPELIAKRSNDDAETAYGLGCDIWSAGVILYCLLSGQHPFDQHTGVLGLFHQITNGLYAFDCAVWQDISSEAKHLVSSMMTVDPAGRPSASECLRHPWCVAPACDGGDRPPAARKNLSITQMQLKEHADRHARQKLLPPGGASGRASGPSVAANNNVGCLLAKGESLEVFFVNSHLKALLACAADPDPAPATVNDLMDKGLVATHRRFMAKVMREGAMPKSLQHPLRAVRLRRRDGTSVEVNVCIGMLDKAQAFDDQTIFFAYCAENRSDHLSVSDSLASVYGSRVAEAFLRGETCPLPQAYDEATVVAVTLAGVGPADADLLAELAAAARLHVIALDPSRFVCVAGTNHVPHDLEFDQAQRAARFAATLADRLGDKVVQAGMATGPIVVSFELRGAVPPPPAAAAGKAGDKAPPSAEAAPPGPGTDGALRFGAAGGAGVGGVPAFSVSHTVNGEAVEEAIEMQRSGRPGLLHLSRAAAARLYAEECPAAAAAVGGGDGLRGLGLGGGGCAGRFSSHVTGRGGRPVDDDDDGVWMDSLAAAAAAPAHEAASPQAAANKGRGAGAAGAADGAEAEALTAAARGAGAWAAVAVILCLLWLAVAGRPGAEWWMPGLPDPPEWVALGSWLFPSAAPASPHLAAPAAEGPGWH